MNVGRDIFAVAVCALLITVVSASHGGASRPWATPFEEELRSTVDAEMILLLEKGLDLSAAEADRLQHLYDDHRSRFAEFVAESGPIRAKFNRQQADAQAAAVQAVTALNDVELELAFHPEGDREAVPRAAAKALAANAKLLDVEIEREAKLAEIADAQAALDEQFFANMMEVFSKKAELLPRVRDEWRCQAWLGRVMMYPEEGVDLIRLVSQIQEETETEFTSDELDGLLQSYRTDIMVPLKSLADEAIRGSRRYFRDHKEAGHLVVGEHAIALDYSGDRDYVLEMERRLAKTQRHHRMIRDINRNYEAAVRALMPETIRARFHDMYIEYALRGYVGVRKMPGVSFAQGVRELVSLTPEQAQEIDSVTAAHVASTALMHEQILRAANARADVQLDVKTNRAERDELRRKLESELEKYRREEAAFIDIVWGLMTEEQHAQIRKPTIEVLPR